MEPLLSNPLEPGTIVGRYRIIGRLAVGGMAELYLADARGIEGFEKRLVLKRIHPQHLGKPEYVSMFLDEARIAATLHHPNIAQVYDIGDDGGTYFFTMEYVDGRDVRHIWQEAYNRSEEIPLEQTITICVGVLAGLHAAHDKRASDGMPLGIVHRDVSPTNVIVTWEGNVKLIDFGIAKAKRRQTMTRNGAVKGKSCSMSPEQARGLDIDRRSDVFSLGIMLWELSVGEPLFASEGDYETLRKIVDGEIDRPSARFAGYDPALEAIVMKALAHSPDHRYQTAQEMLIALDDYARQRDMVLAPYRLARYLERLFPDRDEERDEVHSPPLFLVDSSSLLELPDPDSLDVTLEEDMDDETGSGRALTVARDSEPEPATAAPPPAPPRRRAERALPLDQLTLPRRRESTGATSEVVGEIPPPPSPRPRLAVAIAVGAALLTLGVAIAATIASGGDSGDGAAPEVEQSAPQPAAEPEPEPEPEPEAEAEPEEKPEEILAIDEDDAEERAREERRARRREERRKRRAAARAAAAEREAAAAAKAAEGPTTTAGSGTTRSAAKPEPEPNKTGEAAAAHAEPPDGTRAEPAAKPMPTAKPKPIADPAPKPTTKPVPKPAARPAREEPAEPKAP